MRGSPFFEGIRQVEVHTRGHIAPTPTFYYEVNMVEATFPARLAALRELLPDPRFVPLRFAPGVGAVVVTCWEYRDSDIGPYNELAISLLLADRDVGSNFPGRQLIGVFRRRQAHAFVRHLPVTTDIALALGVDFYAFPKFLASIDYAEEPTVRRCRLAEGHQHILTLTADRIPATRRRTAQAFAHLWMEGQPQAAEVKLNELAYGRSMRPGAGRLELAEGHPIARELGGILLSRRSIRLDVAPRAELILYGPEHLTVPLIRRARAQPDPAPVIDAAAPGTPGR